VQSGKSRGGISENGRKSKNFSKLKRIKQCPNYGPTEWTALGPFNQISSSFTENDCRLTKILDPPIVQNMKMPVIKLVLLQARFIEKLFWKKRKTQIRLI
jgi:hypothetical protein